MSRKVSIVMLGIILGCTSCKTTYNLRYFQVEVLEPGQFTISENIDTIAIFKRDLYKSDSITFSYHNLNKHFDVTDSTINYRDLSNKCVDELANNLVISTNFLKVVNYRDTMNLLLSNKDSSFIYIELHKKTGADICVFLDYFHLKDHLIDKNVHNLGNEILTGFPELKNSTKLERIEASLLWTVTIKGDPSIYVCQQPDKLFYGNNLYPELFGTDANHRLLLENTAEYLGKTFTTKLFPSWQKVERSYYRSNNFDMKKAEKFCMNGEWLKAAEIYSQKTNNKNRNIAAKARYNMALMCEMEGKPDAAIDWLVNSHSAYKKENERHQFYCQQYVNLLAMRKKELERLGEEIRQIGNSF